MKFKKGFLKTMEVFIAITLVFVFVLYAQKSSYSKQEVLNYRVFEVLSLDDSFRNQIFTMNNICVKKGDNLPINSMIEEVLPAFFNYELCVYNDVNFKVDDIPDTKIYVDSYFFSTNLDSYSPRMAKLFYWK